MPDSCKVFIVRSLVPKDLEKDLLKVHPTANCKANKECVLEQASLKKDAQFDVKGKQDKPVPMEVDALLAKASALKDARGDGDGAGGIEPQFHDSCEGGSQRQGRGSLNRSYVEYSGPNRTGADGADGQQGRKRGERLKGRKAVSGKLNYC